MIECLLLAFPTSGYGPVCTFIDDRDGDGRAELVMTNSWSAGAEGSLLVWSSKTHTVLETIMPPDRSMGFAADVVRVDPAVSQDCLLVGGLWSPEEKANGAGVICRLDKNLKVSGTIRAEGGESMFGSHLAVSAVQSGDQFLAAQTMILDDQNEEYSGREWFAIYSLRDHRRKGIIKGSSQFTGTRNASVVCTWVPDCNGDGVQDLAIDMRDRVVLHSGKDLLPIRVLTYEKYLKADHYFGRSLTCIHLPGGDSALVVGLPSWFCSPHSSCMLSWPLAGGETPRRIDNPGDQDGFGCAVCQTRSGDCFASGVASFDGALSFAKHDDPTRFSTLMTEADGGVMIGSAVRCVGDLDGDGVEDVAVTRYNREAEGCPGQGVVLVSGKTQKVIARIELDDKHQYVWR